MHSAGAFARVLLLTEAGADVMVDLPLAEFSQLALQPGETVFLYPKNARVFVPGETPSTAAATADHYEI
jgi:hypothetical protein